MVFKEFPLIFPLLTEQTSTKLSKQAPQILASSDGFEAHFLYLCKFILLNSHFYSKNSITTQIVSSLGWPTLK